MRITALCCMLLLFVGCREQSAPVQAPLQVIAAEVIVRDQPIYFERMAQTMGAQDVEIRARVEGILETAAFREGTMVEKGDLLYVIDPSVMEANLGQAQGNLTQAEAAFSKAQRDVKRLTPLWEKNAISRQMLDDAIAAESSASGAVAAARSAVENMQIQLGYTKIYAPISGLIGKSEVKSGNLVGRGQSTLLATISALDPIHVRFNISEQEYMQIYRTIKDKGKDAASQKVFELILADGAVYPHKGLGVFADRNIDSATGTLMIEVAYPNPDYELRPGQFARVRSAVGMVENAILVPQRAVQELQATYSVFIVTPESKAEFRKVEIGPSVGNFYVIKSGLRAGEKVVVEGGQKLQNNMPVAAELKTIETQPPGTAG